MDQNETIAWLLNFQTTKIVTYPKTKLDILIIKKTLKLKKLESLNDTTFFSCFYFDDESKKDVFISSYNETLKNLKNFDKLRGVPCVLLKRHYLVCAAVGLKTKTVRTKKLQIKVGEQFNFFDQTYYVTCTLGKVTKIQDNYTYHFSLYKK